MTSTTPRVSVGLPVYNGANYLERAITSILTQTLEDFELIISDNASTDATESICRTYAARDRRIRYYRNERNIGGSANFNRLVPLARADYFKWFAHDDECGPEFLRHCVAALDQDADLVLCDSLTETIDEHGGVIAQSPPRLRTGSSDARARFFEIIVSPEGCLEQFGVIRTKVLRTTPLIGTYPGSDQVLLAELALLGRFHQIQRVLWFLRDHSARYSRAAMTGTTAQERSQALESLNRRIAWNHPSGGGVVLFPQWRIVRECARVVFRSDIRPSTKVACAYDLIRKAWWFRSVLTNDLMIGVDASRRAIRLRT